MLKKSISISLCLALLWTSGNIAEAVATPLPNLLPSIQISPTASYFNQEALTSVSTEFWIPFANGARRFVMRALLFSFYLTLGSQGLHAQQAQSPQKNSIATQPHRSFDWEQFKGKDP